MSEPDKTKEIGKYPPISIANLSYFACTEKVKEDAQKAEAAAAGGLEDDDVWGDVEDVSPVLFCINQIISHLANGRS